jgi:hypothetical protein
MFAHKKHITLSIVEVCYVRARSILYKQTSTTLSVKDLQYCTFRSDTIYQGYYQIKKN